VVGIGAAGEEGPRGLMYIIRRTYNLDSCVRSIASRSCPYKCLRNVRDVGALGELGKAQRIKSTVACCCGVPGHLDCGEALKTNPNKPSTMRDLRSVFLIAAMWMSPTRLHWEYLRRPHLASFRIVDIPVNLNSSETPQATMMRGYRAEAGPLATSKAQFYFERKEHGIVFDVNSSVHALSVCWQHGTPDRHLYLPN
jgi:hypothetical protein